MGSHTNVNLPSRWDGSVERELEQEKLKLEAKFYKEQFEWMCREMENVVEAVREWGYVDLTVGKEKIKLQEYSKEGKVLIAPDGSIDTGFPLLGPDFSRGPNNG